MQEISCLFCGKKDHPVAITENGFKGRKCARCGLLYISPRPTEAEISNLYSHDHAVMYADGQFGFDNYNRMAARAVISKIKQHKPRGALLELGSGGGFFVAEAREQGYEPHSVELNPIEAKWIKDGLEIPCESSPLNEASFGGKKFDVIYHKDVLSHLPDPVATFKEINKALKDDGLHVFETGNIADVDEKYYSYFSQFSYPDHLFFFGERSIETLLGRTGFTSLGIIKHAILLQLILQKAFWNVKDRLKDQNRTAILSQKEPAKKARSSAKRTLRKLYRYTSYALIKCGRVMPSKGRPQKLVVFAKKA